jgi:transposase
MRATTLINKAVGLQGLWAASFEFEEEFGEQSLIIRCRRRGKKGFCPGCEKRVKAFYDHHERTWRHLPMFGIRTFIRAEVRRVDCPRCGVKVEKVPWARHDSDFTRPLEDAVAWLLRQANQTAVAAWFGISWEAVGNIAERVVKEALDPERLKGLEAIGVDEFGFGHGKVLTIVVNHATGGLIWAAEGRSADVLGKFFDLLGKEGRDRIRIVTMDMSAAYKKAVEEALKNAEIIYDPFHVTKLVIEALDQVRREEFREKENLPRGILRRVIYALRKNPWNLTNEESRSLREVTRANQRIYRGYLLKESLLKIYQYVNEGAAETWLKRVIGWAARSRLKPFVRVAKTLRKHLRSILAYVREGFSNAILEATNRHLRMLNARAYGFRSAAALIAMAFLHRGNLDIELPWNNPQIA